MTAITNNTTIEVMNSKSKSSGNHWKYTVLEAVEVEDGVLEVSYAKADRYENPNNNTTEAYYNLAAGFYNEMGYREITAHNINMDAVKEVYGKTFEIKDTLKGMGFKWNGEGWVR